MRIEGESGNGKETDEDWTFVDVMSDGSGRDDDDDGKKAMIIIYREAAGRVTELGHRCSIQPSAFARSRLFSDVGDGPKIGGAALIDIVGAWNERGLHIHLRVHLTLSTTVPAYRRHGHGRHRTSFLA